MVRVVYSFGPADWVDRDGIARLVRSLSRLLEPGEAVQVAGGDELTFVDSRPMGGAWVLDQLWRRVGIDATMTKLLAGRRLDRGAERVLFALVANRALDPLSKLAATIWVAERVAVPGIDTVDADACYRSMDWLLEIEGELAEAVYWSVADLLNLEVDLLFFDTTPTYFATETADDPSDGETAGFRTFGHSKDHRPDLSTELREGSSQFRAVAVGWPFRVPGHARRQCTPDSRLLDGAVGGVVGRDRRPLRALSAA